MSEIAVVRSAQNLKRDLLLFDQIHVMGLRWQLGADAIERGIPALDDSAAADCEYLMDEGLVLDAPAFRRELAIYVYNELGDRVDDAEDDEHLVGPLSSLSPVDQGVVLASSALHPSGVIDFDRALPEGSEVVVAYVQSLLGSANVVALLERPVARRSWRQIHGTFLMASLPVVDRSSVVVEVVLPHLPVPGDEVSLESLLDFRREPATQQQITSLKLWMRRAALRDASSDELQLELETMLHDFRRYMSLADMRARTSVLQLAMSIPLHVAEELLHLRPSAALDAMFVVRQSRVNRLEAELMAPGSEVAYLYTAKSRLA